MTFCVSHDHSGFAIPTVNYQIQFGMFVTGAKDAFLVLYNPDISTPNLQLLIKHIEKDAEIQKLFKNRFEEYEEGETELTADSMIPETVKRGGRIVLQCDDDGNIIREFSSASEASEAIGVDAKCIWDTAHGKQKHAGGYCWIYKDEYKPKAKKIPISKKEVKTLNDDDIEAIRERNRKRLEEESKDSKYGDYWTAPKHWR